MEFIKIGEDRYLVKDSNGLIVSEKDIKECPQCNKEKSKPVEQKVCEQCVAKTSKKSELIEESIKPENIK